MANKTDIEGKPVSPMVKGDRAQHVLTGERVTIYEIVRGPAYTVLGSDGKMFRATEMELIRLPKGK